MVGGTGLPHLPPGMVTIFILMNQLNLNNNNIKHLEGDMRFDLYKPTTQHWNITPYQSESQIWTAVTFQDSSEVLKPCVLKEYNDTLFYNILLFLKPIQRLNMFIALTCQETIHTERDVVKRDGWTGSRSIFCAELQPEPAEGQIYLNSLTACGWLISFWLKWCETESILL